MSQLDTQDLDLVNEIEPMNEATLESMTDYEAGAAPTASKMPTPGAYTIRMPELPESSFQIIERNGKKHLSITLDNGKRGEEAQGLQIVGGAYDGAQVRYIRVTTQQQPVRKWNQATSTFEAVEGKTFSDAIDLLRNFGSTEVPQNVEQWKEALRALEGRTSPSPVYLAWEGTDKGNKENGYNARIRQKAYGDKTVGWKSYVERTASVSFDQKVKGETRTVNIGDTYRVYPNLKLGMRGFRPKG